jgi:hypothetical protein
VSEKEIDRNNAVYDIQHNRNPYIDYPVLAEFVWGELKSVAVDVAKLQLYSHEYDVTLVKPSQPDKFVVEDVYDVAGRRVAIPSRGMYIVNYRYSDGTVISRKIIAN